MAYGGRAELDSEAWQSPPQAMLETGTHVHPHNQATLSFIRLSALQCDFGGTDILVINDILYLRALPSFILYLRALLFFILYLKALPSFNVLESPTKTRGKLETKKVALYPTRIIYGTHFQQNADISIYEMSGTIPRF